jgi:hypothetical protein
MSGTRWKSAGPIAIAALLGLFPGPARGQAQSGAQSTLLDPSIRSAGMGEAGVAVFWGGDPNTWTNPSLLGYYWGVRYEYGTTHLVPDLSGNVTFTSNQITLAAYGIGISMEGKPVDGFGGIRLDYGESEATDADGNVIGTFDSWETVDAFSVGFSAAEMIESGLRAIGKNPPTVSRWGDVSLGTTWKSVTVDLVPAGVTLDQMAGHGEVDERDRGLLVRATPYNAIDYPGLLPGVERTLRARVDVSYGASEINDEEATITYIDQNQADPIAKDSRHGWAILGTFTLPVSAEESLRSKGRGWLYDIVAPLLRFGATWEKSQYSIMGSDVGEEITLDGWEVTVANIFTWRQGHIDDPTGTVIGDTRGWSAGLSFDGVGGARYDHANTPQSVYLSADLSREGFTVWLEPIALTRRLQGKTP